MKNEVDNTAEWLGEKNLFIYFIFMIWIALCHTFLLVFAAVVFKFSSIVCVLSALFSPAFVGTHNETTVWATATATTTATAAATTTNIKRRKEME